MQYAHKSVKNIYLHVVAATKKMAHRKDNFITFNIWTLEWFCLNMIAVFIYDVQLEQHALLYLCGRIRFES